MLCVSKRFYPVRMYRFAFCREYYFCKIGIKTHVGESNFERLNTALSLNAVFALTAVK